MRKITVEKLKPGMIIAKKVKGRKNRVLLSEGIKLTDKYILALQERGVSAVYIKDERFAGIEDLEVLDAEKKDEIEQVVKESMENLKFGKTVDYKKVKESAEVLINELIDNNGLIVNLNNIKVYSEYTFSHSVNVAILATLIGLDFGLNIHKLKELAIGALLHDMGKVQIARDIILKPSSLTDEEYEIVKRHTKEGYNGLKDVQEISYVSAHVAYQHHERLDGSGYPRGLEGEQIHLFAQIAAVADMYDAMTTDRIYSKAFPAHKAIDILKAEARLGKINNQFVKILLKFIAPYPLGTMIKLSDGREGIVIKNNKVDLSLPVIRIIEDKYGKKVDAFYEVDLDKNKDLDIEEIVLEF